MNESAVYNESDLAPFHNRLTELRHIIQQDAESGKHPKSLIKLLERQLNECGTLVLLVSVGIFKFKSWPRGYRSVAAGVARCSFCRTGPDPPEASDHKKAACGARR